MLNKDIALYFPKVLVENVDDSGQALIDWLNTNIALWKNDIMEMRYLKVADRMPTKFLGLMNQYLEAGFIAGDSEDVKRKKIYNAIQQHKFRGTWENNVKILLDGITGYISSLYTDDDWDSLWFGDGTEDSTSYWNTWAGDGIDDDLGKLLVGDDENNIYGIVYIDLGIPISAHFFSTDSIVTGDGTYAATQYSAVGGDGTQGSMYVSGDGVLPTAIQSLYDECDLNLQDVVPAYYRVFLGYEDNDGLFMIITEV